MTIPSKTVDWPTVIKTAQARVDDEGNPKPHFVEAECCLAGNWTTCAVAQLGPTVPRRPDQAPQDLDLLYLGSKLDFAVRGNRFDEALELLDRIKDRVQKLERSNSKP